MPRGGGIEPEKLRCPFERDPAGLVEADGDGFVGAVDGVALMRWVDDPLGEDGGGPGLLGLVVEHLEGGDERLADLAARRDEIDAALTERAATISATRREVGARLAELVSAELDGLAMAGARLEVEIRPYEPGPWGADAVVAAAPVAQVFSDALRCAAKGGRINFFAGLPSGAGTVPLDANLIHYNELLVTGTTANTNEDCREALELVASVPELFAPLITHRVPLRQADEAFALAASGGALKVVLEP